MKRVEEKMRPLSISHNPAPVSLPSLSLLLSSTLQFELLSPLPLGFSTRLAFGTLSQHSSSSSHLFPYSQAAAEAYLLLLSSV